MIKKVSLYKTELPLEKPYVLSYGLMDCFKSIIAVIDIDGNLYSGAFTDLPGYFSVSLSDIWENSNSFAKGIIGKDEKKVLKTINSEKKEMILSPINIALERRYFKEATTGKVPLAAVISGNEIPPFKSFKVKVGIKGKLDKEIDFSNKMIEALPIGFDIRIDANQGYDLESAIKFVQSLKGKITYIEQPFLVDKWHWNKELNEKTGASIILDESISSIEDIKKAIDVGAEYIKLKLAKFGSIYKMIEAMEFAENKGLKVIIGNGVDIDTSNYLEACIWQKGKTKLAGEMNGFLKPLLRSQKLRLEEGCLKTDEGKELIFLEQIKDFIKDFKVYE